MSDVGAADAVPEGASVQLGTDGPSVPARQLRPGRAFVFGRSESADVCLDPNDSAMPRELGRISWRAGAWWVENLGPQVPFAVVDAFGFRSTLAPGGRVAVSGRLTLVVPGRRGEHLIVVRTQPPAESRGEHRS